MANTLKRNVWYYVAGGREDNAQLATHALKLPDGVLLRTTMMLNGACSVTTTHVPNCGIRSVSGGYEVCAHQLNEVA
jgi:hypothetical protein